MKNLFLVWCALLFPSCIWADTSGCNKEVPEQPSPGESASVSISVSDPNLGIIDRSFVLHLPAGFSPNNDLATPVVFDFHGWGASGRVQAYPGGLDDVADEDTDGGFLVVHGDGCGGTSTGAYLGSWNCSRTDGPLGPPCVLPRPQGQEFPCYDNCAYCDPVNSCDWTACCNDEVFVRAVLEYLGETYCVDEDSVHLTGLSNGGQYVYYAASRLNDIIASIAPESGSPLLGFGDVPTDPPVSLIDFHGTEDQFMQYDVDAPTANGEGPESTVISAFYFYIEQKPLTLAKWVDEMGCVPVALPYPTVMDGVDGWFCTLWSGCSSGTEVVHCTGLYMHEYPFNDQDPPRIEGTRILWEFMKNHKRGGN